MKYESKREYICDGYSPRCDKTNPVYIVSLYGVAIYHHFLI